MAQINPPIQPTNAPNYGASSRAIDVPDPIRQRGVEANQIIPKGQEVGDRSAEFTGQAAAYKMQGEAISGNYGDLFAGVVGIGDFLGKAGIQLIKKDIEDRVYDVASRERQTYTTALERIKAGTGVKNLLDSNAQMTDEAGPLPTEVEHLPDSLATLEGARDSGKISNTYYYGRLLAEAKDLRAKYPGFKEEIDNQFSKVTGVDPANAYVRSLVGDINRAAASQASDLNNTLHYIRSKSGYPGSQEMYQGVASGTRTKMDVQKWAAPYEQEEFNLNRRALRINDKNLTRTEVQTTAKEDADYAIGVTVGRYVDNLTQKMGLDSPDAAANLDSQAKSKAISPERFVEIGQEIASNKAALRVKLIADADAQGMTKLIGKDEVIKRVDAGLNIFDTLQDRVYHKDFGGIYTVAQQIKAGTDEAKKSLIDSKAGPFFTQVAVMKELGGENWVQNFNLNSIKENVNKDYKQWYDRWSQEFHTQTSARTTGKVNTFNDMVDEAKQKGINDKSVNANIIKKVDSIADPNTPDAIKANLIQAAFSPGNRGFISRLNMDGVDDQGRPTVGQNAVFQRWTKPEITAEVKRISDKLDPQLWTNYQDWAKSTFGDELLNKEINDLKSYIPERGVQVGWDDVNHRFMTKDTRSPEEQRRVAQFRGGPGTEGNSYYTHVDRAITRINNGLYNMKNVAAVSGEDIDSYLLKTIVEKAGPESMKNIFALPARFANAIKASKGTEDANRSR